MPEITVAEALAHLRNTLMVQNMRLVPEERTWLEIVFAAVEGTEEEKASPKYEQSDHLKEY